MVLSYLPVRKKASMTCRFNCRQEICATRRSSHDEERIWFLPRPTRSSERSGVLVWGWINSTPKELSPSLWSHTVEFLWKVSWTPHQSVVIVGVWSVVASFVCPYLVNWRFFVSRERVANNHYRMHEVPNKSSQCGLLLHAVDTDILDGWAISDNGFHRIYPRCQLIFRLCLPL